MMVCKTEICNIHRWILLSFVVFHGSALTSVGLFVGNYGTCHYHANVHFWHVSSSGIDRNGNIFTSKYVFELFVHVTSTWIYQLEAHVFCLWSSGYRWYREHNRLSISVISSAFLRFGLSTYTYLYHLWLLEWFGMGFFVHISCAFVACMFAKVRETAVSFVMSLSLSLSLSLCPSVRLSASYNSACISCPILLRAVNAPNKFSW